MKLKSCTVSGEYYHISDKQCKRCGTENTYTLHKHFAYTALLLGLSLVGCGDE